MNKIPSNVESDLSGIFVYFFHTEKRLAYCFSNFLFSNFFFECK